MRFLRKLFNIEKPPLNKEIYEMAKQNLYDIKDIRKNEEEFNDKIESMNLEIQKLKDLYSGGNPIFDYNKLYGFGKNTVGGVGGTTYVVSNLNDSGAGSFREAVEASGARIITFSVSGTIVLTSGLTITNSNITIDGSTAPDGGIAIRGGEFTIAASEVLIRHVRFRRGEDTGARTTSGSLISGQDYVIYNLEAGDDFSNVGYVSEGTIFEATGTTPTTWTNSTELINIEDYPDDDTIFFNGTGAAISNIMFQNCSISWSIDENIGFYSVGGGGVSNVTFQYCIISEGLYRSHHDNGAHSMAVLMNDQCTGITFYKNLFAHHYERHIRANGGNQWEFINNIVYNYVATSQMGYGCEFDMINNYFKEGAQTPTATVFADLVSSGTNGFAIGDTRCYVAGNTSDSGLSQTDGALSPYNEGSAIHGSIITDEIDTVSNAISDILSNAGARLPKLDLVDTRIINDYNNTTGDLIDTQENVSGYPDLTI